MSLFAHFGPPRADAPSVVLVIGLLLFAVVLGLLIGAIVTPEQSDAPPDDDAPRPDL